MIYVPRAHQRLLTEYGLLHPRFNGWMSMGMGKTAAALDIYDTCRIFGDAKRCLVLGPKRVAQHAWPDEKEKWRESFEHLSMAACVGNPAERKAALAKQAHITTMNYENVEWLAEGYGDRWPFDMVIADESTRLKSLRIAVINKGESNQFTRGQGSVRAKALHRLAFSHVRRWINLTASPAPNGLVDLWGQNYFVDQGRRLGTSFSGFDERWFYSIHNSEGYFMKKPKSHAQAEIEALMAECSLTVATEDYFPVEKVIESQIMIDLPPKARAAYMTMEKDLFALIDAERIDVFAAGPKVQKCMQIANGNVWIDREKQHWEPFHSTKLDALGSVLEEANGDPVLIRYCNRPDLFAMLKRYPRIKFFDDSKRTLDAWNAGDIPAMATHAASAGHGMSLQDGGRILCDYSSEYNLEHDEQIIERIGPTRQAQSGHKRSVYRRRIVARDTIEEHAVLPALLHKMSVQDSLKRAAKMRSS